MKPRLSSYHIGLSHLEARRALSVSLLNLFGHPQLRIRLSTSLQCLLHRLEEFQKYIISTEFHECVHAKLIYRKRAGLLLFTLTPRASSHVTFGVLCTVMQMVYGRAI